MNDIIIIYIGFQFHFLGSVSIQWGKLGTWPIKTARWQREIIHGSTKLFMAKSLLSFCPS